MNVLVVCFQLTSWKTYYDAHNDSYPPWSKRRPRVYLPRTAARWTGFPLKAQRLHPPRPRACFTTNTKSVNTLFVCECQEASSIHKTRNE